MKTIFVGGPIQYAIKDGSFNHEIRNLIETVVSELIAGGYHVTSAHRYENYGEMDVSSLQQAVCIRDFNWMKECDLFIAVLPALVHETIPVRTDGTCVELGWASVLGKKIIVINSRKATYSHLVAGLGAIADVTFVEIERILKNETKILEIVKNSSIILTG